MSSLRAAARALVPAALAPFAFAAGLDLLLGEEVLILARRHDQAETAEERRLRDPRDPIAWVYGRPEPPPVRVLVVDRSRRIAPVEAPGQVLLHVDRARGEAPILVREVWAAAATGAGIGTSLGAVAIAWRARRRARAGPSRGLTAPSSAHDPGE